MSSSIIKSIKIYTDTQPFTRKDIKYRQVFRTGEFSRLYVDVLIQNPFCGEKNDQLEFLVVLFRYKREIERKKIEVCLSKDEKEQLSTVFFENITEMELLPYKVGVVFNNKRIEDEAFFVYKMPEAYTDCFRIRDVIICPGNTLEERTSHVVMDIRSLSRLEFVLHGKSLFNDWFYEFFVSLFDSNGELIETCIANGFTELEGDDLFMVACAFGENREDYWRPGNYRIELIFMNQKILVIPFTVSDYNMTGMRYLQILQPHTYEQQCLFPVSRYVFYLKN